MKLTLNAIQYKNNSSGIGQHIYNLYNAFFSYIDNNKLDILVDLLVSKDSPQLPQKKYEFVNIIEIPFRKDQYVRRNLYELFSLGNLINKTDLYFTIDAKLPLFIKKKIKKVPTVTDLAVYRMGNVYQASRTFYWKILFKHSIKKSNQVISISQFTKKEIVDIIGIDQNKIDVVYCGVNKNFKKISDVKFLEKIRKKYSLQDPFLLFVGTFSPRKNLYGLIKAFELFKEKYSLPHKLVIVGEKGWKFNKETKLLEENIIKESIIFPGYIPDEDLPAIYNIAEATVFPSFYEGFGLPVIESMACGTPVVLSNASCLPEVAGDAAHYFDPYNIQDMCDKVYQVISNVGLQRMLITKGYERAKMFSWDKAANELIDIFMKQKMV